MAMTELQHMPCAPRGLSSEGMRNPCNLSATHPAISTYGDFVTTPYSAVSSFNQPATCDSTLLTPISGAGSPPLSHSSGFARPRQTASTPNPQQPTPPSHSKMYSSNFGELAASSQAGSPMSMQAPTTESHFDMNYIVADSSAQQRKDDIPEPPEPYFGSFGVSETEPEQPLESDQHLSHAGQYPYYVNNSMTSLGHAMDPSLTQSSLMMGSHQQQQQQQQQQQHEVVMSMGMHPPRHTQIPRGMAHSHPEAPILSQPHPGHMRGDQRAYNNGGEMPVFHGYVAPSPPLASTAATRTKKSTRRSSKKSTAQKRRASTSGARRKLSDALSHSGGENGTNPEEDDHLLSTEPLQFKEGIPDNERFLFELRNKYSTNKGKGMWEPITREYNERFGTNFDRAALQMKISRSKSKWVLWNDKMDQVLFEAAKETERSYFRLVQEKFRELGGKATDEFSVGNVEARMSELGLSDIYMESWKGDPSIKTRRRRKLNERQRQSAASGRAGSSGMVGGENDSSPMMTERLPLSHHLAQHHPQGVAYSHPGGNASLMAPMYTVDMTPEQHERMLEEIHSKEIFSEPGTPHSGYQENDMHMKIEPEEGYETRGIHGNAMHHTLKMMPNKSGEDFARPRNDNRRQLDLMSSAARGRGGKKKG